MKIKSNSGFSLLELMIVTGLLGIIFAIASFSYQRYVNNENLRTAARELVSDFNTMKQKAATTSVSAMDTTYTIDFNMPANQYTMNAITNMGKAAEAKTVMQTKTLGSFGSDITFNRIPGGGSTSTLIFLQRGTFSGFDTIELKNNRNSTATITFTITGKTYVTFNSQ